MKRMGTILFVLVMLLLVTNMYTLHELLAEREAGRLAAAFWFDRVSGDDPVKAALLRGDPEEYVREHLVLRRVWR